MGWRMQDLKWVKHCVPCLKAIASETRIKILLCLGDKRKTVAEIVKNVDISQSTVSQQLSILKDRDIVDVERRGKNAFYFVKKRNIFRIIELIKEISFNE